MKAASIVPTAYLQATQDNELHMCLAHLIEKDPEYTAFYKNIGKDKNKTLIMDNGACEDSLQDLTTLVRKAELIQPSILICPDVLKDCDATVDLWEKSFGVLQKLYYGAIGPRILSVPQGNTISEWMNCATYMLDNGARYIGVPKHLTYTCGQAARYFVISQVLDKYPSAQFHLLGCNFSEEVFRIEKDINQNPRYNKEGSSVTSIDSCLPWLYAVTDKRFSEEERPDVSMDFTASFDDEVDERLIQRITEWNWLCDSSDKTKRIV